jgi:hypothetical protein
VPHLFVVMIHIIEYMNDYIKWCKFLRDNTSLNCFTILDYAWYNNKYWKPEGSWPYGMKRKYK